MQNEKVLVVDTDDLPMREIGKLEAHQKGLLHRAFSVFIFNSQGEMLLQQRAIHKYHGGGLWSNACCSHPQWKEEIEHSATKRLQYEMGLQCPIYKIFSFIYKIEVENNLIEHEFDHVFIGYTDAEPTPRPDEVKDYQWLKINELVEAVAAHPDRFTAWFKMAMPSVLDAYRARTKQ